MKKRIFATLILIIAIGFSVKPAKDYFQEIAENKTKLEQETAAQKAKLEQEELIKSKNKTQIDDYITRAKQALYSVELTKQTIVSDLLGETISDPNAFDVAILQRISTKFDIATQRLQGQTSLKVKELQLEITKIQSQEALGAITKGQALTKIKKIQDEIYKVNKKALLDENILLEEQLRKVRTFGDINKRLTPLQKIVSAYIEFQKPLSIRNQDGTEQLLQIGIILVDKLLETKNLYLPEIETVRKNIKKVNEIKLSDSTFKTLSFNDDDFIIYKDDINYMVERLIDVNKEAEYFYQALLAA